MKSGSLATKCITIAAALFVLVYFAVQIKQYFADPRTTTVAYEYQVEDSVTVTGYVIRNEEVLTGGANGIPDLVRAEGERVGAGQRVAVIYQDESAVARQREIESVQVRLEQLEYARESAANSEASLKLDSSIAAQIRTLHAELSADDLADAEAPIGELRTLVSKRDYTYRDSADLTGEIAALTEQLKSLKAAASSGVSVVRTPKAGVYSAEVDGYETVLTPAMLDGLTPSSLGSLLSDGSVSSLGKMIYGDEWYFATVLPEEQAKAFSPGKSTDLRFAKGLDKPLTVQVRSVSVTENGNQVVVFSCRKYISQVTLLRKQSADLISSSYTGLRVPRNALRVITTMKEDEEGVTREVKTTGVYCLVGMTARFKPVNVEFTGDGFCLLTAASTDDNTRLRAGDQVITSSEELYDGKVMN